MGKSLFFRRRDDEVVYWRCGVCGQDRASMTGSIVKVGPTILAVVCVGCVDGLVPKLAELAPRSFPEVDSRGIVLDGDADEGGARRAG